MNMASAMAMALAAMGNQLSYRSRNVLGIEREPQYLSPVAQTPEGAEAAKARAQAKRDQKAAKARERMNKDAR